MLIACHAWGYNNLPLEQAAGTIARLGFRAIDLGTGPHIDTARAARTPDAEATVIRGLLARFNLTLADLYIMLPQIAPSRNSARRRWSYSSSWCRSHGARHAGITISPGIIHKDGRSQPGDRSGCCGCSTQ